MIGSKLTIGLGIVLLLTLAASAAYFKYSQSKMAELNQEVAIQETRATIAEANTKHLRDTVNKQQEAITELAVEQQEIQKESFELAKLLARHNLAELAKAKPGLIQSRVNRATAEVLQELESIK